MKLKFKDDPQLIDKHQFKVKVECINIHPKLNGSTYNFQVKAKNERQLHYNIKRFIQRQVDYVNEIEEEKERLKNLTKSVRKNKKKFRFSF